MASPSGENHAATSARPMPTTYANARNAHWTAACATNEAHRLFCVRTDSAGDPALISVAVCVPAITTIGAALLAGPALAPSGCSCPGAREDRAAVHPEAQYPVPSAPATEPTEPETPAEETGDESTEEGGQGEKSGATADLGVEDGHVQYLRAIQNFSPALER